MNSGCQIPRNSLVPLLLYIFCVLLLTFIWWLCKIKNCPPLHMITLYYGVKYSFDNYPFYICPCYNKCSSTRFIWENNGSSSQGYALMQVPFSYPCSFLQGMELYPRIGKHFDIKVFTNCRFGMMSWAVLAVTYCIKQVGAPRISLYTNIKVKYIVSVSMLLSRCVRFKAWHSVGYIN